MAVQEAAPELRSGIISSEETFEKDTLKTPLSSLKRSMSGPVGIQLTRGMRRGRRSRRYTPLTFETDL